MSKSGCIALSIGFESGSDRVLKFLGKHTTREQNLTAAEICHRYGINIIANYMFGIPTETEEEAWQTVSMMQQIRPYVYLCSFFTPTPGTGLYTYCERKGLLIDRPWEEYSRYPDSEKIKGVDYELMKRALAESQKVRNVLERDDIGTQMERLGVTPKRILLLRSVRNDQFQDAINDFRAVYPDTQLDILVPDRKNNPFTPATTNGEVFTVEDKFFHVNSLTTEQYDRLRQNTYDAVIVTCRKTYHAGYEFPEMIADRLVSGQGGQRMYFNEYRELTRGFVHATQDVA
ncbi:MAG: radical SAM protein [Alphaproteobacteria bacterium]|nr:radical SAM protein [Alphaproteobacteria bacterium]